MTSVTAINITVTCVRICIGYKGCHTMTSNAKLVARWWSYKTRQQQDALPVVTQWLESGQHQELNSTGQGSTPQITNDALKQ